MPHEEFPKTYEPKDFESEVYRSWEESGFFNPDNLTGSTTYCNILPPPNANGELHLGHASGYTIMDLFGRFQRMRGKKTLLLPGKDHAGIQSQVVFEKKILAERSISRHDLGREQFFSECYDFCVDRSQYMRSQEKKLGLSADWSREKFTLDPEISKRAIRTFVRMYEEGLIYRGDRITNWCPRCATALSDIEVIHKETDGIIFFVSYAIKNSNETITVASTRPETMRGDTASAVHPDDERYESSVGKSAILPIIGREIPIIADERIDQDFGTGAVKITPAHDPLDWEIGKTHSLEVIQVIGADARITKEGGQFQGLPLSEARKVILETLRQSGNLAKEKAHTVNLSSCERCKTAIEPIVSRQWFVNVDSPKHSLKKEAIELIRRNKIEFHPKNMRSQMIRWIKGLHDWCISRQLWWGQQIPVWYRGDEIFCGVEAPEGDNWKQDPDTLDTWFSSGQWPYTTLGYPEKDDAIKFYPTDTMIMGRDLLFFWAARMIVLGNYTTKQAPFKHLYFTGLIRDKNGLKMSKSKGNGTDPIEMIHQFGADAVRLSLTIGSTPGLDFRLYEEKIATFRNFTNKLWNIGRYVATQSAFTENTGENTKNSTPPHVQSDADQWILSRFRSISTEVTHLLENYHFSLAGELLRDFTWSEFADWYIEIHKTERNDTLLQYVFENILKLWHPFMPFVTETLWKSLGHDTLLMIERWPEANTIATETVPTHDFHHIIDIIVKIRTMRSFYRIDPKQELSLSLTTSHKEFLTNNESILKRLARIKSISYIGNEDTIKNATRAIIGNTGIFIHLEGIIDTEKERTRLEKEIENLTTYIHNTSQRLENEAFRTKAPEKFIHDTEEILKLSLQKRKHLHSALSELG